MKLNQFLFLALVLLFQLSKAQNNTDKAALENAKMAEDNKDYEEALKWFKKANQLNPKNATTYYDMAWCHNELNQYEEAIKNAIDGIKVSPSAKLYTEYGYALYKLEKYTEAIEKYKKAIALEADNTLAVKGIADASFSNKDYATAEVYYKKCLALNKSVKEANYKLGYIMNENKKYQNAVEYELKAIALDKEYAEAYNELGYAYSQQNLKSAALDNYIKAANLKPDNATYATNVADLYYGIKELKNLDKAAEYYKKSLDINDNNAISNFRLGWIYNEKEQYADAKRYLNKAVQLDSKYAEAWVELGWVEYAGNNYTAAESDYQKAILYDSKTELGRYYLGLLYIKQGKNSSARKMVDELKALKSVYAEKLNAKL